MSKAFLVPFVIVIWVFCVPAKEKFEGIFSKAKHYYEAGNYDSTISILRRFLTKHGREESTEYIVPLLMEALVRKDDYNYFNRLYNIYKRKFPKS